ncbi:uncharacterized protein I303_108288 [Kwoniella dejecticola CBS 10117]|uniref:Uncharacterized protein n=1 Tax=Kwoniella dejecticola CBS 10117 TaxID=1296121 RepID=A0A1A5ZXU7_9TREE|nr:uncharacterized protein I303_07385 [Kwoniella dejecticola CBS 10117]OBR82623.1 hypothetical protein I303_07385 [Kwoniella dejecticola CBS 10117]
MLRRIRGRLHPTLLRPPLTAPSFRLSSSAALARSQEVRDEPYGVEYGAGPSRIPYEPSQSRMLPQTTSSTSSHTTARALRQTLNTLKPGSYAQPHVFMKTIFNRSELWSSKKNVNYSADIASMSRLELHIIINHLIRLKKGNVAAALICDALALSPREKRKTLLSIKCLSLLFQDRSSFYMHKAHSDIGDSKAVPDLSPSIESQAALSPSRGLGTLLNIMDMLQDVRYQRPLELYSLIIKQCVDERLYDLAAKVYVGLVEEWVTEGRVAHGANPDDFHPGGGPPRSAGNLPLSKLLGHWWTGVRTWRLPGEVLSPHDRLDLWHPKHLSLGEKMKNFPLPIATSPPSLVPQPKTVLLNTIIVSLKLDPKSCAPREFASSMRALAILANTVLSRTLPIVSLGKLLQAFKTAPNKPDVYPETLTEIPAENQWAYTSFTQIHVTLMSLLFAPPISSHSMQLIAENQDTQSEEETAATAKSDNTMNQYMLPPLSWKSCTILLRYAFEGLRKPFLLKRLLAYMKDVFGMGGENPQAFNTLLKGASALQLNAIASQADDTLFGDQKYDRPPHAPSPKPESRYFSSTQRVSRRRSQAAQEEEEDLGGFIKTEFELGAAPLPDHNSLLALIKHLTVTSQFIRLESLVYILEPYLEFSKKMSMSEVEARLVDRQLQAGGSGRPRSQSLPYEVYIALLQGLEKAGSTGLAQRVFNLALYTEKGNITQFFQSHPKGDLPSSIKFPLDGYRIMINVWGNETRHTPRTDEHPHHGVPVGWELPRGYTRLPRGVAAGYMTMVTHHLAKKSHPAEEFDQAYFESLLRACRWRWKLSEEKPIYRDLWTEMRDVCQDIEAANLEVPDVLVAKLKGQVSSAGLRWNRQTHVKGNRNDNTAEEKLLERLLAGEPLSTINDDRHDLAEGERSR